MIQGAAGRFEQLQAFVAIADFGRFILAASHLGLTQSAVSILIKELESELQQRLFDRNTRMVSLTAAAREFLPQARPILGDLDIAFGRMRDLGALRSGSVFGGRGHRARRDHPLLIIALLRSGR